MSWYNRKPRSKNPPTHLPSKNFSPATERRLEEIKKQVREKSNDK